jgi:hypothetical protein
MLTASLLAFFSCQEDHLPAKTGTFFDFVDPLLRHDQTRGGIELVGINQTQEAEAAVGDNSGILENFKAWRKHFLELRTAQLMSDVLRGLHVPAYVSKSIHNPLISGRNDKVTPGFHYFRGQSDVLRLILDVRDNFLGNDDIEGVLGEVRLVNVPRSVFNVWAPRLGSGNALGREIDPVCFAEICKPLSEPTSATSKVQDARLYEVQTAYKT